MKKDFERSSQVFKSFQVLLTTNEKTFPKVCHNFVGFEFFADKDLTIRDVAADEKYLLSSAFE